ncbi:TonB-dependent siderophore receptor [Pseudotabrizicola sp. 4114]|uniref:TonB-dependent siderophore receptor n=1 Tax=Pseudotabrizicola sp. 4114 TaxID=2817731 RepID=UPI002857CB9F|nr:iron complex outermembrane receptor protein [Pseudorhodobacter sp. 4114]
MYPCAHRPPRRKTGSVVLQGLMLSCAVLTVSAGQTRAQDDALMLDLINIQANTAATAPVDGYLAATSAGSTKTDTPLVLTPQSTSVVTADEIRDRTALTLADALAYTPGFTANERNFSRVADRFRIRGFDVEPGTGGLMRDGMRLQVNSYDGTQEPFGLERVDVVRGAASVLYGQLSPGGLVNGVSKRPTDTPLYELGVEAGSHGRKQLNGDFSDKLSDTLSYRLTVLARDSDTATDFIGDDRVYIAPALTWRPSDDTSLTVLGFYQNSQTRFPAPLPYGIIDGIGEGAFSLPRDRFIGEPGYDHMESDMWALGYEFSHRFANDVRLSARSRYYESDLDWRYLMAQTSTAAVSQVINTGILARQYSDRHDRARGLTHDMNLGFGFVTGAATHDVLFGYDFQDVTFGSDNFRAAAPSIDLNDPVYGIDIPVNRASARNRGSTTDTTQHGLYLQDQIRVGNSWNVLLGLRHDWADQTFSYKALNQSVERKAERTTWRTGVVYEAENGLAPYASYSQSFFPIAVAEYVEDITFDPMLGEQFELGLRYQPPGSNMMLSASIYQLTQDNVVARNLAGDLTQIGQQRARGFELEAKGDLTDSLSVAAAYAYTDARITRSETAAEIGQRSENTPYHQASLWLNWDLAQVGLPGLTIGSGIRYNGTTAASGIDKPIPGNTLVDALVRYEVKDGLDISLNATNLFDKKYASCDFGTCRYGDRREVTLTARHRW